MTYERFISLSVWVCSVLAPVAAVILVFAYRVEPPTWSAYITVFAVLAWVITAPWGLIRGVIAYQEEGDALVCSFPVHPAERWCTRWSFCRQVVIACVFAVAVESIASAGTVVGE